MIDQPPGRRDPGYRILGDEELNEGDHAACLEYW